MTAYTSLFEKLDKKSEGAFIPFTLVGYPNPQDFLRSIDTMIAAGADALELGLPFSDPVADGPIIQAANVHTLSYGFTNKQGFDLIKKVSVKHPDIPIGLLVYGNLVMGGKGIKSFYQKAKHAGVHSVLIADIPTREIYPFKKAAQKVGINQVLIAPPNAKEEVLKAVALNGAGYTYVLGRAGITGIHEKAKTPSLNFLKKLEYHGAAPLVAGFGFSNPDTVRAAIQIGLKGVICGSAIINYIPGEGLNQKANDILFSFCQAMKQATLTPPQIYGPIQISKGLT